MFSITNLKSMVLKEDTKDTEGLDVLAHCGKPYLLSVYFVGCIVAM